MKRMLSLLAMILMFSSAALSAQSLGADPAQAEPAVEQVAPQGPTQEAQVATGPVVRASTPSVDTTGISQGPFSDGISLDRMLSWYHALYGSLVLLIGFVVKGFKLPGTILEKIPTFLKVVAAGAILAAAFVMFGWKGTLPYVFSFLAATGIYNLFRAVNQIFKR